MVHGVLQPSGLQRADRTSCNCTQLSRGFERSMMSSHSVCAINDIVTTCDGFIFISCDLGTDLAGT